MEVDLYGTPLAGLLSYSPNDHAFGFEPDDVNQQEVRRGSEGSGSIQIGTLQIEVSVATNRALYVWGYHPMGLWETRRLHPPLFSPGWCCSRAC